MNRARYLAYRGVRAALERPPSDQLDPLERERLRDTAEGLLLTTDEEEAERLRRDAAVAISLLVAQRRWSDSTGDRMWQRISDCGPPDPHGHTLPPTRAALAGALGAG